MSALLFGIAIAFILTPFLAFWFFVLAFLLGRVSKLPMGGYTPRYVPGPKPEPPKNI